MTTQLPTRLCRGGGRMAVTILAVALVAACGGGSGAQTTTSVSGQTPPAAPAVPPTTAAAIAKPCLRAAESTHMFRFKTSAPYGPNERWLTVVSPEDPDGVELVLHLTDEPARTFREATREQGRRSSPSPPPTVPATPRGSRPGGVVFVREPARMDYGGMDAVFDDTCGNLLNLHQD